MTLHRIVLKDSRTFHSHVVSQYHPPLFSNTYDTDEGGQALEVLDRPPLLMWLLPSLAPEIHQERL